VPVLGALGNNFGASFWVNYFDYCAELRLISES